MNRRQFLTRALTALPVIAAPAALVEALTPKRSIFLPPRGGWTLHEESNTVYLVNEKYFHVASADSALIDLVKRRMHEASISVQENLAKLYWGPEPKPWGRIGGIDVYIDRNLPEDTFEFRQA